MRAIRNMVALAAVVGLPLCARAQQQLPAETGSRPLLEQLDREAQNLYDDVRRGMVLVRMPAPIWLRQLAVQSNPVNKWSPQLDPHVRAILEQEAREAQQGNYNRLTPELVPVTPGNNI